MKSLFTLLIVSLLAVLLAGCLPAAPGSPTPPSPGPGVTAAATTAAPPTGAPPTLAVTPTATPRPLVPDFKHIVLIVLENKEFGTVIGNPQMPYFNSLANSYTLLTQFYAVTHPSLPNYLAMISGQTFGLTFDCYSCSYDAPTLPDQIEASGRTWKTYQEDMPGACADATEVGNYAIKHNPFVYFKAIRLDAARCTRSVVPLTQLPLDMAAGPLPDYVFITPNLCNDAHDCDLNVTDGWLNQWVVPLKAALDTEGTPYLLVITWDEGQGNHSCCGLPQEAGGRIATILISPQVKEAFQDDTQYTGYSLLKTIEESWHFPYLGHAADAESVLITAPWK
jgi:phospholipase C